MFGAHAKAGDARFSQMEQAVETVAAKLAEIDSRQVDYADTGAVKKLAADLAKLSTDLSTLTTQLSQTPNSPQRPLASGADANQTDC
jgi:uncharacterized membrane protein YqiK